MDHQKAKAKQRLRRRYRVRNKIFGTAQKPRLSVFRSSKHIYAQLIDDENQTTLATASSLSPAVREGGVKYGGNVKAAQAVGKHLAELAAGKGITAAAFDRGHYRFHGRVKALALAANAAGLKCSDSRKPQPTPEEVAASKKKGKKEDKKAAPAEGKAKKEKVKQ